MEEQKPIYRARVLDRTLERATDLHNIDGGDALNYSFSGLSGNDWPVVSVNGWTADIFSIQRPGNRF
jgi:hypothetical protein